MTYQNSDLNYSQKLKKQQLLICNLYVRYFHTSENGQMHLQGQRQQNISIY